ncbi:hypothetical protein PM082_012454 [Marasmius tenuissimus]|nr:hypothetical protein PM082_012454 [Marasmius tenuissimus]
MNLYETPCSFTQFRVFERNSSRDHSSLVFRDRGYKIVNEKLAEEDPCQLNQKDIDVYMPEDICIGRNAYAPGIIYLRRPLGFHRDLDPYLF